MLDHQYQYTTSIENLLNVWRHFLSGKRYKQDVIQFQIKLARNLDELHDKLERKIYIHGPYSVFTIADPKPRIIHKASVRDRVVHHLIYKTLYWHFHFRFIHDSYSCRLNKGPHKAIDRFNTFARRVSKNHTRTCYVLKCDIKKFFASINQEILLKILERHIADSDLLWLIRQVVSSFFSIRLGVGLPLGNLTSQLLANVYLHEFDMYVKQELRVKYYIRFADDFLVLSDDKKYLESLLPLLQNFLQDKLHLIMHEYKVFIKTCASGVDFLGWVNFPYYRQLRTITKRKMVRKLQGYPKKETVNSYRGLLTHGNTYKLRKKLEMC
jgi:retron-type reverse transcriptase